jgi:RimJ/RimL family protein N-acetyltransferase
MKSHTLPPANHEPMLRGSLVYLRPGERSDVPLFVRWMSDARTTEHLALRSPIGLAIEERWFEGMLEHHGRDRWFFVICRLVDGRPVGTLDLHDLDHTNGSAGIGIAIGDPADTGQGYGSDALQVLARFGFEELRLVRVWLDVYEGNAGAHRLYERLGFVHEATFRHGVYRRGRYVDVHRLGLLREEWNAPAGPTGSPQRSA